MLTGSCLCGAIRFEATSINSDPDACHCSQCRNQSGHVWASVGVLHEALTISGEDSLRWYAASAKARRGFCGTCGSFLFWEPSHKDYVTVALGACDSPTGLKLAKHIYVADKGDYYDIGDGLPQDPQ